MKLRSPTLAAVLLDTRRRREPMVANAAALALLAALVSEAAFHRWSVGTAAVQIAAVALLAAGTFVVSLVGALLRVEGELRSSKQGFEVIQCRIGVHKGIAAVLEGVAQSAPDDAGRLRWLAHRAVEVLRTDRYLNEEKVRQVREIATNDSLSARLAKLKQHLSDRLIDGRYVLP